MIRAYCPVGDHFPDEVIVTIPHEFDDDRICVIVNRDGTATNRWADGTIGLNPEQKQYAEEDESSICPIHHYEIKWSLLKKNEQETKENTRSMVGF